jgi:2-keto-3-deoxy-L-rhamnonate aldolase RhmA
MAERTNPIIQLLATGQSVFGIFSGDKTPQQGAAVSGSEADFVFYSLETGPFDIPTMTAYMDGMRTAADSLAHPVVLRVPPLTDEAVTRDQVARGLEAGVAGIVFPHVARPDQAATSVAVVPGLWPADPDGDVVSFLIIEDREGIANTREIVATAGPTVVFAGPGDLRRAYDGDMDAVEAAIQTVLATCLEMDVPCGVTAGAHDIVQRLDQGFRVIIATEEDALPLGRRAAGRNN